MDLSWLWKSVVARLVWELLLMFGGAAVLAYLKAKKPLYAAPTLYSLVGLTSIAVLLIALTGRPIFSLADAPTSAGNVEDRIRTWSSDLGLGIQNSAPMPDTFFSYQIKLSDGNPIMVYRNKSVRPDCLVIVGAWPLSSENQAALGELSEVQANTVMEQVNLELNRSPLNYVVMAPDRNHPTGFSVEKEVTIANFTEEDFSAAITRVDHELMSVKSVYSLGIAQYSSNLAKLPDKK